MSEIELDDLICMAMWRRQSMPPLSYLDLKVLLRGAGWGRNMALSFEGDGVVDLVEVASCYYWRWIYTLPTMGIDGVLSLEPSF